MPKSGWTKTRDYCLLGLSHGLIKVLAATATASTRERCCKSTSDSILGSSMRCFRLQRVYIKSSVHVSKFLYMKTIGSIIFFAIKDISKGYELLGLNFNTHFWDVIGITRCKKLVSPSPLLFTIQEFS